MLPSNQSWISSSNDGWCSSRFGHRSLWKFGKVDVVVDTTNQKAYCHYPFMSHEQPLSMRFSCDLFKKLLLMVSLNLEVRPLHDDRLMATLKLDIGIYNIGIKVSKCIIFNLVEPSSCVNNSFWSKPTLWMIFHTWSVSPSPLSILEVLIN
jgi:hypothetical protein